MAHPIQIHILVSHDSGRTAERTYLRDEDGWALLTSMREADGIAAYEDEEELGSTNDALWNALTSLHEAFKTMREPNENPLPELVPVDAGPQNPGAMN